MSKKILMLLFLMLVLISVSAVSAVDVDGNNDAIVSSADAEALTVENDVDTIDLNENDAGGDDVALANDANAVAEGNNEIYGEACGNLSSQLIAASDENNVLENENDDGILKEPSSVWYVDVNAASGGDGKSEATAFKNLEDALDKAVDNDIIKIASGTYTGDENTGLTIDKILSFEKYGDDEAIFDAQKQNMIWTVTATSINICGLTFKNGKSEHVGALYFTNPEGVSNSIINAKFISNTVTDWGAGGAAINFDKGVTDSTINSTFIGNSAQQWGAACAILFGRAVNNVNVYGEFINNTGKGHGAIFFYGNVLNSIIKATFINNSAATGYPLPVIAGSGGALYFQDEIINLRICSEFINNNATWGGAIQFAKNATGAIIENCVFVNNYADAGSAVHMGDGSSFNESGYSFNDNWWGSNNPDWSDLTNGAVQPSSWAVLKGSADQERISLGSKTRLNYAFYRNGTDTLLSIPVRPIELSATKGQLDDTSGYLVNGKFSTKFTSNISGANEITATVDNQEVKITVIGSDVWYVDVNAAPGGDGKTEATAFRTLKDALNNVVEKDIIRIAPGKYSGDNNIGLTIDKNLSFEKYGDDEVIFDAEGRGRIWFVDANSINILGLTFKNAYVYGDGGAIFFNKRLYDSNINARFINNTAYRGGAIYFSSRITNVNINSTFIDNTAICDTDLTGGGAICVSTSSENVNICGDFINNTVICGYPRDGGGAIAFFNSMSDVSISANFIGNVAQVTSSNQGGAAIYFGNLNSKTNVKVTGIFINNKGNNVIQLNGGSDWGNDIHDSVFLNNDVDRIIYKRTGNFEFNNNWFGSNATNYDEMPANVGIVLDNWLFLNATADPSEIEVNESSKITFKLYYKNSPDVEYNASKMNIELDLAQTLGELDKPTASIGEEIYYTAKDFGDAVVTGKFETASYTLSFNTRTKTAINVANPNIALNITENVASGATLTPADAGNLTYTSSNSSVAIVRDGEIFAVGVGSAIITVSFAGNEEYAAAENKTINVTVSLYDASVSVNNSTLNLFVGDKFDLVVTTVPEGLNVTYVVDNPGVISLDNGVVTALNEGTATITFKVGGDGIYAENSTNVTVTVKKVAPEITISGIEGTVGETVNAVVTIAGGDAAGIVIFDNISYAVIDGQAIIRVTLLSTNMTNIAVNYTGDNKYLPGNANKDIVVYKRDVSVVVVVPSVIPAGTNATVEVFLPVDAEGNVTLIVDGIDIGDVPVVGGSANFTLPQLNADSHTIEVAYSGDDKYLPGNANKDIVVYKQDVSVVVVVPSVIPAGTNATVEVFLPVDAEGNVTLIVDGIDIGDVPVVGGSANFTLPQLNADSHTIEVAYSGDDKYNPYSKSTTMKVMAIGTVIEITKVTGNCIVSGVLKDINGSGIANAELSVLIKGNVTNVTTDDKGVFTVPAQNDVVTIAYAGSDVFAPSNTTLDLDIAPVREASVISAEDYTTYAIDYNAGERGGYFKVQLVDENLNPLANKPVKIGFNGKVYNTTTNETGWAQLQINLAGAGTYTFAVAFLGDDDYNASFVVQKIVVNKKKTTIDAPAKSYKASDKTKSYTVTLKTDKGSSIDGKTYMASGKKITMTVNGKTYTAKTNSKGQATFKLSITKKGTFSVTVKFDGDKTYAASSKSVKITIK